MTPSSPLHYRIICMISTMWDKLWVHWVASLAKGNFASVNGVKLQTTLFIFLFQKCLL